MRRRLLDTWSRGCSMGHGPGFTSVFAHASRTRHGTAPVSWPAGWCVATRAGGGAPFSDNRRESRPHATDMRLVKREARVVMSWFRSALSPAAPLPTSFLSRIRAIVSRAAAHTAA